MGKKAVVTGGCGFIGSNLAAYFAEKGWDVIALDDLSRSRLFGSDEKSAELNVQWLEEQGVEVVVGSILDPSNDHIFEFADAVFHCAAQTSVGRSVEIPFLDFEINALGSVRVLENVRLFAPDAVVILCSSNKALGNNACKGELIEWETRWDYASGQGVTEDCEYSYNDHTAYGCSKIAAEYYFREYAKRYGVKAVIVRFGATYGPRQFGFEGQGWLQWITSRLLRGEYVNIFGDGKQVRDCLYVSDLCRAFEMIVADPDPGRCSTWPVVVRIRCP